MKKDEMFLFETGEKEEPLPKWLRGLYYCLLVAQGLILLRLTLG